MNATDRSEGPVRASSERDEVVVRVRAAESELRSIRLSVREFVSSSGGSDDDVADFELVASELATNVMQHSEAENVTVSMRTTADGWELDVDDAENVPDLDGVTAPAHSSITGRGLLVVTALMDDVRIVDDGDRMLLRCTKSSG